jgi:hypothetical protein
MDVSIDTSSLSNATNRALVSQLIGSIKQRRVRLIVCGDVLAECLNSTEEGARQRLETLFHLAAALETRLILADELRSIHKKERAKALNSTPKLSGSDVVLAFFRDPHVTHDWPTMSASIGKYLHKEESLRLDKAVRARPIEGLTPRVVATMVGAIRERFWSSSFVGLVSKKGKYIEKMRHFPSRYRSSVTLAAYWFLNALGASATHGYGSVTGILSRPRWGNWVDAQIAASSAYCSTIVTDDSEMRRKVDFIGEHFTFPLRATSLDEWLASTPAMT